MNILTPTEISECLTGGPTAVARAIEQAVIAKLAQGVSVERLKNIDWQQFAMHGGEPCFDLDRDGSLCGRARHWFGHNAPGSFVSLHDFATTAIAAARVQALEEAAKVCDRQAIPNAGFLAEKVRALMYVRHECRVKRQNLTGE